MSGRDRRVDELAHRGAAADHVAASDCERIRPGLIGQPANTLTSLAFVVAAVPIARRARATRSLPWAGVAASAALEGVGSVAYHGPGGRRAKAVHDIGLVALAATMAAARVDERSFRVQPAAAVLGVAAVGLHALSRTGGPLCSCGSRVQGHAVFHVLAAAALVAAATAPPAPHRSRPATAGPSPPLRRWLRRGPRGGGSG